MLNNVSYKKIDDQGLHISKDGKDQILEVENVIICAGQESYNQLYIDIQSKGIKSHLIGGAFEAAELDARKAIEQGTKLGLSL
jgi:2,4-dienoyl-CoA reductase (NADPH2)